VEGGILLSAEIGFGGFLLGGTVAGEFELEGAVLLVDVVPDYLV